MSYRFFLVTGPVFFVIVHFLSFLLLLPFLRFLLLLRRFRLFCLLTGKGRLFVCLFNTLVGQIGQPWHRTRIFRTERVTVGVATIRKESRVHDKSDGAGFVLFEDRPTNGNKTLPTLRPLTAGLYIGFLVRRNRVSWRKTTTTKRY